MSEPAKLPATHWVELDAQLRVFDTPARHDIVDRLSAFGPSTVTELATVLGMHRTALYHHLRKLEQAGLVRSNDVRKQRGRPPRVYEAIAPRVRLARAAEHRENRAALGQVAAATAAHAAREYARGFHREHWAIEGPPRNHWFFRMVARPSAQRLARINALLDEVAELVLTPDPDPGPGISVTWFLSPIITQRKETRDGRSQLTGVHPRRGGRLARP